MRGRWRRVTDGQDLAVVGFTRFSVDPASILAPGQARRPLAELRAALYDPHRLRQRLALFRAFAFPSMRAAARSHPCYRHVVLVSPALPARYRARLELLRALNRAWMRIGVVRPEDRLSDVTRRLVGELAGGRRSFTFRLDDDDALRPDSIARIRERARDVADGTILSFDRGYYVQRVAPDGFRVHEQTYPQIGIGLGIFSAPDAARCIFAQGLHQQIDPARVTNVTDGPYWIRCLHRQNDSGVRAEPGDPLPLAEACRQLAPGFGHLALERALMAIPETRGARRPDATALRALFGVQ